MTHELDRRKFLQRMAMFSAATLLPFNACTMKSDQKYKIGLQLFTIRDAMKKDPLGSLKKARVMGYEDLEIYGYNGDRNMYYGFKANDFKKHLEDLELTSTSGHYGFHDYFNKSSDELYKFVDQCIEGAHVLDQKYITWPWLDPESRSLDAFKKLAGILNVVGERITKTGLGFAYHNHNFEFIDHDGQNGYDIILENTDPEVVKLQLDLYWVKNASKLSPREIIAKAPGRFVMWHIKDMDKITRDYTELGNGSIDYTTILTEASTSGLEYYYLEQGGNYAHDSMRSIEENIAYFKQHLQPYL
jgi:sugar phosphate isomerase/epimerase